jgi:hypothetical protein
MHYCSLALNEGISMSLPDAATERIAMAYYYIWYSKGWFDGSAAPPFRTTMSGVHPAIGPYDSSDLDVIAAHMDQCKRAKLDALAISWWKGKNNAQWLSSDPLPDCANQDDILDSVMTAGYERDIRSTIILEVYSDDTELIYDALKYYIDKYRNDPRALHAQGKPVVCTWNTWILGLDVWNGILGRLSEEGLDAFHIATNQPDTAFLEFFDAIDIYTPLSPTETAMQTYTGIRAAVDTYNLTDAGKVKPGRWHATVMPGFEDRLMPERLDRDDYAHFRYRHGGDYYWETFAAAMASQPDWLHVTSFNELAEHSYIEDTLEYGTRYLDLTARFIEEFKASAHIRKV